MHSSRRTGWRKKTSINNIKENKQINFITDTKTRFGITALVTGVAAASVAVAMKVSLAAVTAKFGKVIVGVIIVVAASF